MASLRDIVTAHCRRRTGRVPDLETPRGLNDCIQWLKINDQRPGQIAACDKIAVRGMIEAIAGPDILIPASPEWPPVEYPCVAKCNHDSSSAVVLHGPQDAVAAYPRLRSRLATAFGVEKGEWAYGFIRPALIVERKLPDPVIDYKFHCSGGVIRWVQVVWDRPSGKPREQVLLPDGTPTNLRTNEALVHDPHAAVYPGDEDWQRLGDLARLLAKGWRYVRVDLLFAQGRPWFGELTFWPRSGCFYERDERAFGEMLELDISSPSPALVA